MTKLDEASKKLQQEEARARQLGEAVGVLTKELTAMEEKATASEDKLERLKERHSKAKEVVERQQAESKKLVAQKRDVSLSC